jgi:DNA-binding MarR family transcriptional regulator
MLSSVHPPEGNVKVVDLNATQGSLLGFLHEGPKTGWDLLQDVERGLARFWNITPSHVYRELRTLEADGLVKAGKPGARDRRPFTITAAGRRAFAKWIAQEPGTEQIRFPLLVSLWFGRHLTPDALAGFLETSRKEHEARLALYRDVERAMSDDDRAAVVRFGVAYEQAVLAWLDDTMRSERAEDSSRVAVALHFVDCINRRDLPGLTSLMTDDHELRVLNEPAVVGRGANSDAWRGYFDAFPRYVIEPRAIAESDGTVAVLGHTIGSHLDLPDDEERERTLIWLAEIEDGRLRSWSLIDDTPANRERFNLPGTGC